MKMPQNSRSAVIYGYGKKGFPLTGVDYTARRKELPTETLLLNAISVTPNARLIEGSAVVIDNDPPNYKNLVQNALHYGLQNQAGYILEGALMVLKKHKPHTDFSDLEWAVKELYAQKMQDDQFLTHPQVPNPRAHLLNVRPPEAARWNVLGNVPYSQFETQYRIYQYAPTNH
jgi:hypothetical protein